MWTHPEAPAALGNTGPAASARRRRFARALLHGTRQVHARVGSWLDGLMRRPGAAALRAQAPGALCVAIATLDGHAINATLDSASSFVLYELSEAAFSYVGLLGCAFTDPRGRGCRARRRAALNGVDLVLALDSGTIPGNRPPRGSRLIVFDTVVPLAAFAHAADARLALGLC